MALVYFSFLQNSRDTTNILYPDNRYPADIRREHFPSTLFVTLRSGNVIYEEFYLLGYNAE
jgi:hypothetical protein